jgi:hypothetical protein
VYVLVTDIACVTMPLTENSNKSSASILCKSQPEVPSQMGLSVGETVNVTVAGATNTDATHRNFIL